jgi:hypothetical protein
MAAAASRHEGFDDLGGAVIALHLLGHASAAPAGGAQGVVPFHGENVSGGDCCDTSGVAVLQTGTFECCGDGQGIALGRVQIAGFFNEIGDAVAIEVGIIRSGARVGGFSKVAVPPGLRTG